ncbi:Hypp5973 [Branchiostoma lanceolatum]|uniref:Hypp5973 protein n=1 Tax=Branchiostoma lanceolatum TaxID=7740 RepID=A0A8J9YS65_BRALA|nr:Hypp5973 [Branchiostoma lanceolatum]
MPTGANKHMVEAGVTSSHLDGSTENTKATEMCTACSRPAAKHVEAGNGFGPECIWRRKEPTHSADPQQQQANAKDVTSPPEAAPDGSSPSHTVSEDEIARLQAERDKLLRQYEVNRLQQEISTLRAILGASVTLAPASQAFGATALTNITPAPPPISVQNITHQPHIQTVLHKLSTSMDLLSNILSHSTDRDDYHGHGEALDTDQWSPSSSFVKMGRDPNSGPSRPGDLTKRPALQRVGIDTDRDWLESRRARHSADEDQNDSTDSGVYRGPAVSPTSQFGGLDMATNEGQGRTGLSRAERLMRRRTLQNERVQYWNSKIIMNEKTRIRSLVHYWIEHQHAGKTDSDDERRHSYDSRGSPAVAMSNSSQFGGSMPDLHINYNLKHHHGSLRQLSGMTESTRKLGELSEIGERVEEHLMEDAKFGETSKKVKKIVHAANRKDPWAQLHNPRRLKGAEGPVSPSADHGLPAEEASRRWLPQSHQSRKRSVRSRQNDYEKHPGGGVSITTNLVEDVFVNERIPKADSRTASKVRSRSIDVFKRMPIAGQEDKTSKPKGWASLMSRAQTAKQARESDSANTTLQDVLTRKSYKTDEDIVKTPEKDTKSGLFGGFKGLLSVIGADEQEEKKPAELETDVSGFVDGVKGSVLNLRGTDEKKEKLQRGGGGDDGGKQEQSKIDTGSIFSSILGSSEQRESKDNGKDDEGGSSLWGLLGSKSDKDPAMTSQMSEKGKDGEGESSLLGLLGSKSSNDAAMMSQMSEKGGWYSDNS